MAVAIHLNYVMGSEHPPLSSLSCRQGRAGLRVGHAAGATPVVAPTLGQESGVVEHLLCAGPQPLSPFIFITGSVIC